MKVCWFSAGVSSFVAALLSKPDKVIYIDIDDQHPDSMRFVKDCEKVLGQNIEILKSPYGCVKNACRAGACIRMVTNGFSPCTAYLKQRVRKEWEAEQDEPTTHIWGFDVTERKRAERVCDAMPNADHEFPLIDSMLSKADVHGICALRGVRRPAMYDLGYNNNNCVGCVKGGMGYWNKIRVDFPEVFAARAKLEREIGNSCINRELVYQWGFSRRA